MRVLLQQDTPPAMDRVEKLTPQPPDAMIRFRRWAAIAVGLAVLGYLAYAVWTGFSATAIELARFWWPIYVPVIGLTLVNYGLRYAKWHYLLVRLGIRVPHRTNVWIFLTGLAMAISPAKAGELVKPYLLNACVGAPAARTIPVLVVERGTDGLAVVLLAAVGVSTYYADAKGVLWGMIAASVLLVVAVSIRPLALGVLHALARIPVLRKPAAHLEEVYEATWTCLRPLPLTITMVLSIVAWFAECVGYWLVFEGLDVHTTVGTATFLYTSATVFGAPSPGGMGMADAALTEGAVRLIPAITDAQALAASMLVRFATLWFGVLIGAIGLLRMERMIVEAKERG